MRISFSRSLGLVGLCLIVPALLGCQETSAGAKASTSDEQNAASPGELLKTQRQNLAIVEAAWQESPGALGPWKNRGSMSPGVFVVSDGHWALVLVSRHAVDPRFGRPTARTRNSSFRVSTPGQRTAGEEDLGRLVAVYMNQEDLALLRVPAPRPEAFALDLGSMEEARAGDRVTVIGLPSGEGFALGEGIVSNLWTSGQGAGRTGKTIQLTLSAGSVPSAGVVFSNATGKLIGMIRGQLDSPASPAIVNAIPADYLSDTRYWDHLLDEAVTTKLLAKLR